MKISLYILEYAANTTIRKDPQTPTIKEQFATTALSTVLASACTQTAYYWTSWRNPTTWGDFEGNIQMIYLPYCKIWGFHGGDYEEWCRLGCYAVWLL
jgi:hypothetical protein